MLSGNYNKVPLLIGYCNREGMLTEIFNKLTGKQPVHDDFESSIPYIMNLKRGSPESKQLAQKIKDFYYGDEEPSLDTIGIFYDVRWVFFSVRIFANTYV